MRRLPASGHEVRRHEARRYAHGLTLAAACILLLTPAVAADDAAVVSPAFADKLPVRANGNLLSLADVIRNSSSDKKLAAYRQLRAQSANSASGQLELAKWCRKQKLGEEELLHWKILLQMEPDHPEAIKALHLRRYRGSLLTREEIDQAKRRENQAEEAARRWRPALKQLRQAIDHGTPDERAEAIRTLREIQDPAVMPALEEIFPCEDATISLQVVDVLSNMPGQEATDALARLAVDSPDGYAREQAAAALGSRADHSYVPRLVGRLAAPIELGSFVSVDSGGPSYEPYQANATTGRLVVGLYKVIRLRSEYTFDDVAFWTPETVPFSGLAYTGDRPDRIHYEYVLTRESPDPDYPYAYTGYIDARSRSGSGAEGSESLQQSVAALKRQIEKTNTSTAETNRRINAALKKATGEDVMPTPSDGSSNEPFVDPRLWWNWWRTKLNVNNYVAAGTEIWTQTGLMPIEEVMVGDRVLARDPSSGELAFQLVIGFDRQLKAEARIIKVGSRTIVSTPEQPFFVHGDGWRPAKKLEKGMQLESLAEPQPIEWVETSTEDATYSLMVADVPDYFVDRQGILVHDATRPAVNSKK